MIDLNVRLDALRRGARRGRSAAISRWGSISAPDLWPVEVDPAQLEIGPAQRRDQRPRRDARRRQADALDRQCRGGRDAGLHRHRRHRRGHGARGARAAPSSPSSPPSRSARGPGSASRQIHGFAAQTGGRAEIRSTAGEGTALRLFLPRTDKAPPPAAEARRDGGGECDGKTILLVEDNDHVRDFADGLLADLGYAVVSAASAEEALARLRERRDRSRPLRHRHARDERHRAGAPDPRTITPICRCCSPAAIATSCSTARRRNSG